MTLCSRYHLEVDCDPVQGRFVAGAPSDELLRALGVRKHHLPEYIYRMRQLGYPPGWLLDAQDETSGVNLFDSDGNSE